ncbi:MAG: flagellar basal body P-ring protein FlgI [Bauldia sp.]|nr:flagellar basal body P-ring protein FlgI [Bauldia sp.]
MKLTLVLAAIIGLAAGDAGAYTRIKDITSVVGVRDNQLIGYGLAIGLQGTGDSMRNAPFTEQSLQAMLDRMGVNVTQAGLRVRNVAAIMVTANLPAFASVGSRIDVNVSSVGDASSLNGGTLLMTPLTGADGRVYAVAQGAILVSGFAAAGTAASVSRGVPTDGRIPNGAIVEREVAGSLDDIGSLVLDLQNPDFATATLIADLINSFATTQYGKPVAQERDMRSVVLRKPEKISSARFLAEIGDLLIYPDAPARIVINQRTGTVVIGQDVRISTVGMTHGNLTVRVTESPVASQPLPFSKPDKAVVLPRTQITATEQGGHMALLGGTSLQTLIDGLNQLVLKPTDIIAILQAIKTAGALQAELVIQ